METLRKEEREKGVEEKGAEFEFRGLKLLKKGGILVGKNRGGVCTPPPTWNFETHLGQDPDNNSGITHFNRHTNLGSGSSKVSARQLGANLLEVLPHRESIARMSHTCKNGVGFSRFGKNKGLQMQTLLEDSHDNASDEQPVSTGSFHRQITASVMQHHRSFDRNGHNMRPVSPASYGSSMEVTPYNPAATPSSSLEYKGMLGDPSYNLKTSTELLKVLNRIWSLEEQHATNVSRVKAFKVELDNARTRIKELLREKQMDKEIIDDLMKQAAEYKLVKKNMEHNRVQSALQSLKEELEDERKLRKRSESMHRKLAREIYDMKSSFSKALNELERERRARILLEDLCDEFAMGIRDYEQELRSLQYRTEKEHVYRGQIDSLVLHISEAWLDERLQMKLAEDKQKDVGEKSMIVDKLRPEIETFLKARQSSDSRENIDLPTKNSKGSGLHRQSLESFPLNEATSAPQNADDEDDDNSIGSASHCFELNKNLGRVYSNGFHSKVIDNAIERDQEIVKMDSTQRKDESRHVSNDRNLSSLQTRFEKHMARVIQSNGKTHEAGTSVERYTPDKSINQEEITEEGLLQRRSRRFGNQGESSNHMLDNLLRTNSSSIEGERIHPEIDLADNSHGHFLLTGPVSPMKKWDSTIISQDAEILESSSRWAKDPKGNSLKAKLLEARLEGRNSQLKGSKGS